jgi:hypothetical protein
MGGRDGCGRAGRWQGAGWAGQRGRGLQGLPQAGAHVVWRPDCSPWLFPHRVRRAAKVVRREGLCGPGRARPVPAGAGQQRGGHRHRRATRGVRGRSGGLARLHPALGRRHGAFRLRRRGPGRCGGRRLAARPESGRGCRGRAGRSRHDALAGARSRTGDPGCGRCRHRVAGARRLGAIGGHRIGRHRGSDACCARARTPVDTSRCGRR